MSKGKLLSYVGSAFFVVYGISFSVIPHELAEFVTGATPGSPSAAIDLRATYGGMSVAVGVIIYLLANNTETVRIAVVSLLLLMLCMASTRVLGILLDGDPNSMMYVYLGLEVFTAGVCGVWLKMEGRRGD